MIDVQALKNMESFRLKNYKKGDIIVQEGMKEIDDSMYILLKGRVEVWKNHQMSSAIKIAVLNPGEFFGEMTLFLSQERSATVVAAADTIAAEINSLDTYEFFKKQPEATYMLISTLCRRLNNLNEMYNKVMDGEMLASINTREEEQLLSSIFPKGHKKYDMAIDAPDSAVYADKSYACPMCRNVFRYMTARDHMLKPSHIDKDFRVHYKNAEPVYYEIVTCPQCWYSTFGASFEKGIASRVHHFKEAVEKYKAEKVINVAENKNISDIFASYYLALECANSFMQSEMIISKIWLRLSWLYHDCGDSEMEQYASEQACRAYKEAYSNMDLNTKQLDQVCLIIGELCLKLGDIKTAREFFFQVKKNRSEYHSYIAQAEDRLEEIKELLKQG